MMTKSVLKRDEESLRLELKEKSKNVEEIDKVQNKISNINSTNTNQDQNHN